jgi:hypothetical protein
MTQRKSFCLGVAIASSYTTWGVFNNGNSGVAGVQLTLI